MRTVYWVWSMVLLVMIVLQIAFAGYGAFYAAGRLDEEGSTIDDKTFEDGFGLHIGFGYLVFLAGVVLLLLGLIAGVGRWRLGKHGVVALLLFVQIQLAWAGGDVNAIGALHPLNAFVILGLTAWIVWSEWERRKTTVAAESQAAPAA